MAKSIRDKIKLVSSADTGHYYTTTKNKRTHPEKLETTKYDPVVRKHVVYKEAKIKAQRLRIIVHDDFLARFVVAHEGTVNAIIEIFRADFIEQIFE